MPQGLSRFLRNRRVRTLVIALADHFGRARRRRIGGFDDSVTALPTHPVGRGARALAVALAGDPSRVRRRRFGGFGEIVTALAAHPVGRGARTLAPALVLPLGLAR